MSGCLYLATKIAWMPNDTLGYSVFKKITHIDTKTPSILANWEVISMLIPWAFCHQDSYEGSQKSVYKRYTVGYGSWLITD